MHSVEINPPCNRDRVWFVYAILILLNAIDVVYTNAILVNGAEETNPIMNFMYQNFGMLGITTFKAFCLAVLGICIKMSEPLRPYIQKLLYLAVMVYSFLTAYHVYWLFGFHG